MNSNLKILIAEHDPTYRIMFKSIIKQDSLYEVEFKHSLSDALGIIFEFKPNIILIDISLPDLDGKNGVIRILDEYPGIPIIVINSRLDNPTGSDFITMGAQDFLSKVELNSGVFDKTIQYAVERQKFLNRQKELEEKSISEVIQAEDKVRERIGHELHDSVGQMLTSVLLSLNMIDKKIQQLSGYEDVHNHLDKATALLNKTINEVRTISHNLMPAAISLFGLINSVNDLVETLRISTDKKIGFYTNLEDKLDSTLESSLYRIIQEAVNNSLKYGAAQSISIQIIVNDEKLVLLIEDDGAGFELDTVDSKRHLGLVTMKHRATGMNGTFEVDTAPGKGTAITVQVPVKYSLK
jgi:signal transduction histidine kinase